MLHNNHYINICQTTKCVSTHTHNDTHFVVSDVKWLVQYSIVKAVHITTRKLTNKKGHTDIIFLISIKYAYVFTHFTLCFLMYFELIWVYWKLFL